jgi:predicted nucleotidyltransferase
MLKLPTDPLSREERFTRVRAYLAELRLRHYQAWVFGSVARGDFTKESDTDVLIISDELPVDLPRRLDRIFDARTVAPEIEPIGWLVSEWRKREVDRDPFVGILKREAVWVEEAA